MGNRFSRVLCALLAIVIAFGPLLPKQVDAAGEKSISMDFDGVDLTVFIKFISELTGKNFIIGSKVRGKVTILSPRRVSADEAYNVFESVLAVYGFIAVPSGDVVKIVQTQEGRNMNLSFIKNGSLADRPDDKLVTQIIPIKNVSAAEVRKILAPMASRSGLLAAYNDTNSIILIDFQSNIQRLLRVINAIDVKEPEASLSAFSLEFADAAKAVAKITAILGLTKKQIKGQPRPKPILVADERTNTLIVMADKQDTRDIESVVKRLDRPAPAGKGNIKVYYLENADAEDLAKTLAGLVGKKITKTDGKQKQEAIISEGTVITADKATNSLIVTAAADDYKELEDIIGKLDVPRKQVYVEALIMETSTQHTYDLGVDWRAGGTTSFRGVDSYYGINSNYGTSGKNLLTNAAGAGMSLGIAGFPIEINGVTVDSFSALINLVQTDTKINVISTPQIMTLDNEEASIVVAENRPFKTSQDSGQSSTDYTNEQFTYKDVGNTLKVTPQVGEGGTVKLKIYQEYSVLANSANDDATLPITRTRKTETSVVVKDGQTVVIGGLIGKSTTEDNNKVPGLGDIPVLGWLFKSEGDTSDKTNMLVFITPRVVSHPLEADELFTEKVKHMEDFQFGDDNRIEPLAMKPVMLDPLYK